MTMREGPVCLRQAPFRVPHLDTFLQGWYRGFDACGVPAAAVPPTRLRRWLGLAMCSAGLHRGFRSARRRAFAPLCWASDTAIFPAAFSYRLVPWIFDCWPADFDRWAALLGRLRVDHAFVSSQAGARGLAARLPGVSVEWMPEAADPLEARLGPALADRQIDVLELGRRFEAFHAGVAEPLRSRGFVHVFNGRPGIHILTGPGDLRNALADSRISICYPKSVTHPQLAGPVETATHRYFEAFAAGCLPVGRCPDELRDLWGFDPVVEVAPEDAAYAVPEILRNIASFQSLVDRNHARFLEVGCWVHRASQMIARDRPFV